MFFNVVEINDVVLVVPVVVDALKVVLVVVFVVVGIITFIGNL